MTRNNVLQDIIAYLLVFGGLSVVILIIHLFSGTAHGLVGNLLATILAAFYLVWYRWQSRVPGMPGRVGFSLLAGLCAIVFLIILQLLAPLIPNQEYAPVQGYQALVVFLLNAGAFAGVTWLKIRYR
ncbi:hypothetical protein SAMN05216203_2047 [Marinobacter daqiaonensis]|uniref:Uncharacterized protein n=1 Tax=Marinobacter daqiaonensis TaxID=650891 RepID=A0A1I6IAT9_9GAMM|nr:hypothetical protein [Marinobacter daqiaonensis]SFR63803.1 hypothetical protein SAMN05216203_2047 [Marinobacter daqiaonensis]